jgi:DNA primase
MSVVDEVKARLDIVDIVSSYVSLQKAGRNFKAPCPFHNEKTPSFIVSPERESWHCFGACSTGGDAISFVMRREGMEFGEALRMLADKTGVVLSGTATQTKSVTTFQVNEAAAAFYQSLLYTEAGESTRQYLKSREVSKETARSFKLGLSPIGTDSGSLRVHLLAEGFTVEQMIEAGLVRRFDDGNTRDFFRGRLMYPIADRRGRIAGFGARTLDGTDPKYINTPGTSAFDKRSIAYGLHLASESIRVKGQAIVVEGYMDVIAAHQHGHHNVVASMGTALTDTQMGQLRSLAGKIVLALDADAAGQEATVRKLEEMLVTAADRESRAFSRRVGPIIKRDDIELKIALLPEGSDPDDLIRNNPDAWSKVIEDAVSAEEFMIHWLPKRFDLSSGSGKTAATEWVARLIYAANPFDQERYRNELADVLGVTPDRLEPILRQIGRRSGRRPASARTGVQQPGHASRPNTEGPDTENSAFAKDKEGMVDDYALALLVQRPRLKELAESFPPECFHRSDDREIFTRWMKATTLQEVRSALDPALSERFDELANTALEPTMLGQSEVALGQILARLEERHLRRLQDGLLSGEESLEVSQDVERAIIKVNTRLREIHARRG